MPKISQETQLALISQNVANIQTDISQINDTLKQGYVSIERFTALKDRVDLLQRALLFLIGVMTVAVLGAIFRLVFR